MQNNEELRQKGHNGSKKRKRRESGKKFNFQKGGGDKHCFRIKIYILAIFASILPFLSNFGRLLRVLVPHAKKNLLLLHYCTISIAMPNYHQVWLFLSTFCVMTFLHKCFLGDHILMVERCLKLGYRCLQGFW